MRWTAIPSHRGIRSPSACLRWAAFCAFWKPSRRVKAATALLSCVLPVITRLSDRAMGFCLFNTIAIGAQYLKRKARRKKDPDHGLGRSSRQRDTKRLLRGSVRNVYFDASVSLLSRHRCHDRSRSWPGRRLHVNVPLPAGCADAEYLHVFDDIVRPAANKFQPEWVLVSAGF